MTQAQAIRLVCRAVVLYLLFWVITDVIALPREILSVHHAWMNAFAVTSGSYYLREQILYLASNVLLLSLWSVLALWFYQAGPRIQRWFGSEQDGSPAETTRAID
jgi:hypothetical protein